jgi:hypothetical protein
MRTAIDNALEPKPRPTTPSSWSPTPPPTARIDDANTMDDITPSPAADGPFTLVTEHTLADNVTTEKRTLPNITPRLLQLAKEGKTIQEIGEILYNEEAASHAAGSSLNV